MTTVIARPSSSQVRVDVADADAPRVTRGFGGWSPRRNGASEHVQWRQRRGPIKVKFFWSAVLRLFITIGHHASQAMAARNVSHALLKTILNEGKKTTRNGVAYVRYGNYEARVNVNTGKVITVVKLTGGGGGGGGV